MHAHDRFLPEWFSRIRSRQITLPRFQRFVAWGHAEVSGLLTTVLRGLPSGAALILEVGDEEKFSSRTMVDAPDSGEKVNEQLLDGQQRLTALWRSLHDKYEDRTYLIGFEEDPGNGEAKLPYVFGQARWVKNGKRYPVWTDDPAECWQREFIPISLLRPADIRDEIDGWIEKAIPEDSADKFADYKAISSLISDLRTNVREFNLPYLALPAKTPKEVALDVFIKMNTNSVKLSTYDIVVALVEDETGNSLHEHVDALAAAVPRAVDYADLPSLVLDVVALRQDRVPSQAGYRGIDYTRMLTEWESVVTGIKGMVTFLEDESIFDDQRLPSYTAIPIVAALWEYLPTHPDQLGNARHLLRKFLWRAFLTSRYEQSSTTNALQDYRGLRRVLNEAAAESSVPILNEESFPSPTREMVLQADWPKRKSILGRGLLALMLKAGAKDLADGARALVPGEFTAYRRFLGDENVWRSHNQVVCPMDSVKPLDSRRGWSPEQVAEYNRERFEDLIGAGWDLVIVDEAHRLGGSTDQVARFKLGQGLAEAAPYLLLLSATPHQGKTDAFHRLVSLLDAESFPEVSSVTRERVRPFVIRAEKRRAINAEGKPLFRPRRTQLIPVSWKGQHKEQQLLYEAVTEYVREGYNQAMREKRSYIFNANRISHDSDAAFGRFEH